MGAVDPHGRDRSRRGSSSVPQNPRLWEMLVAQAKQKFQTYPSLPASKWVHQAYLERGGTFVDSSKKDQHHDRRGRLTESGRKATKEKAKKAEARQKQKKGRR